MIGMALIADGFGVHVPRAIFMRDGILDPHRDFEPDVAESKKSQSAKAVEEATSWRHRARHGGLRHGHPDAMIGAAGGALFAYAICAAWLPGSMIAVSAAVMAGFPVAIYDPARVAVFLSWHTNRAAASVPIHCRG